MNETDAISSSKVKLAVYKGLTVAVYMADNAEINLTRQDLVELVNVCNSYLFSIYINKSIYFVDTCECVL